MKTDGPSELADILDDIVASIGEILVTHAELTESMVDDTATSTAAASLERLKKRTDAAKKKLADLKDRQQHKREVERRRKESERAAWRPPANEGKGSGMLTLRTSTGRVIGFMRVMCKNQTDFFSASGKLVAREVGEMTYANGKAVYRGRLGLVVLGQTIRNAQW